MHITLYIQYMYNLQEQVTVYTQYIQGILHRTIHVTALGVLCYFVVGLFDLAYFFFPSHLSLKHVHMLGQAKLT